MLVFSNCKINIGLYITEKRADGYHNLETVFYPVPLYDVIELMEAPKTEITIIGQSIPGAPENNIVLKAWHMLKQDFPILPSVHFYLLKNIPVGAGLGSGSANGAYTLIALNRKYRLQLSMQQLIDYALQLGSDCPFFIINQPCIATGRGEVLKPIELNLSGYQLVIVNPGIHVATTWAFGQTRPRRASTHLCSTITMPVASWRNIITNDFEESVIHTIPEIGTIKNYLYQQGAEFVLMSGSGSTVYGLFKKEVSAAPMNEQYFIRACML